MATVELGPFATQPALGLGDLHALAGTKPDQVGLELSYKDTVLPPIVKARVSVEAGIAMGWRDLVGVTGQIVSLEHYGASADEATLFREFGFTAEAVALAAEKSINDSKG